MKYIIRRIIIGVGIAIAMMFITRTFSLSVHAATTYNLTPIELRLTYTNTNSNTNTAVYTSLNELTNVDYPYTTFYGRSNFNQNYYMTQQLYRFETTSSMKSNYYDLNFLIYFKYPLTATHNLENSFTVNIRNNSRLFVCHNDNTNHVYEQNATTYDSRQIIGVKCENVYLDLNNNNVVYAVIQSDNIKSWTTTEYGISPMTFQVNSSGSIQNAIEQNTQAQEETTQAQQETNDILNDDDTSDAQSSASSFFSGFSSTDHGGLSGIITAPMRFIQRLTNYNPASCRPIAFPLPFMNRNASIPCLSSVVLYSSASDFVQIYRTITTGLIAYWVIVKVFAHIRSFKKPDEDKVEVLEL